MTGRCPFSGGASRRGFLGAAGGLVAVAGTAFGVRAETAGEARGITPAASGPGAVLTVPFRGEHQSGILTPLQSHTVFAALDLTAAHRAEVVGLLRRWTEAAERMMAGNTAGPLGTDLTQPAADSGEALGLAPSRLTITIGFGPGLFERDGHDRYGLGSQRPEALAELPRFNGDQLAPERTGGDLSVQACADDPQVAFHAVRQMLRLAYGAAEARWLQTGFTANYAARDTPRNLLGFKDGTQNPIAEPPREKVDGTVRPVLGPDKVVWVGEEGPAWLRGGSYVVMRRIRMSLEHWDRTEVDFQEQVIGRHKVSGAPIGADSEFAPLDLDAQDKDGNPVIAENAHVRLAAAASNGGAQILRRSYSYNDGVSFTAERWPPWRQGMLLDAGLLFVCYQRDPRQGFTRLFEPMAKLDALNQFTTHVGGGLFACPGGAGPGEFIGQRLFESV